MPSIENFATHVKINGIPYAKNTINYQGDETVYIYYLGDRDARVLQQNKAKGHYSDWTLDGVPYATAADLKADLDRFIYSIVLDPLAKAKGLVAGLSESATVGINTAIVDLVFKDLWGHTSDLDPPTAGEQFEVSSSVANDAAGQSGAQTVTIFALDTSYNPQIEVISLNGTSVVTTVRTDWFTPGQVIVAPSGSSQWNEGTITIKAVGTGKIRGIIKPTEGRTFNGFFTVPAGKTFFIKQASALVPKNQGVTIVNRIKLFGTNTWISGGPVDVYQNSVILPFKSLPVFLEKTDIRMTAKRVDSGTATVSEQIEGDLVDGTNFPIATIENMMI